MAQKKEMSKSKNNDSSIVVKVEEEEMPSSEPKRMKIVKEEADEAITLLDSKQVDLTKGMKIVKEEADEAVTLLDSKQVDLTKIVGVGVVDPPPTKKFTDDAKIENFENHEQPSPLCVLDDDEFAAAVIEWAEQNGY